MYQISYYIYSIFHLSKKIFSSNQDKWLGWSEWLGIKHRDKCTKLLEVSLPKDSLMLPQEDIAEIKKLITAGESLQKIRQECTPEVLLQDKALVEWILKKHLKDSINNTLYAKDVIAIQEESENVCFLLELARNWGKKDIQDANDLEIDDNAKKDDISSDAQAFLSNCVKNMWLSIDKRIRNNVSEDENIKELTTKIIPKFRRCWSMINVDLLNMPLIIFGDRALHSVIRAPTFVGQQDIIKALLQNGANPNVVDEAGYTPLVDAICYDATENVKILLADERTDVHAMLHFATELKKPNIVKILSEHERIDINFELAGCLALRNAIYREDKESVKILLAHGARLIITDLNLALARRSVEIVEILLTQLRDSAADIEESILNKAEVEERHDEMILSEIISPESPVACNLNMLEAFAKHMQEKKKTLLLNSAQIDVLVRQVTDNVNEAQNQNETQKKKLAFIFHVFALEQESKVPDDIKNLMLEASKSSKKISDVDLSIGSTGQPRKSARATGDNVPKIEKEMEEDKVVVDEPDIGDNGTETRSTDMEPEDKVVIDELDIGRWQDCGNYGKGEALLGNGVFMGWHIDSHIAGNNKLLIEEHQDLARQVD